MRTLAMDTATRATSVAVWVPPEPPLELRDDPAPGQRPRHTTRLLALAAELLERRGLGWEDLERIVVGVGPGTFTGLRVGVATARALAAALEVPLVGVSTLRSLATNAAEAEVTGVLAVLDARRKEVFAAGWRAGEPIEPVIAPAATAPEVLVREAGALGAASLAIGEGAVAYRPLFERSGIAVPDDDSELHRVSAGTHCRLADEPRGIAAAAVMPVYLRLPDAEIALRAAGRA
jgi:tRNA threonylcarbamoyladenosine biosynthesis protein TsaB